MIIPMLSPNFAGKMFGITAFNPGSDYRYAMAIGASLMAGWTLLLIWASRKPLERRGVLLLTCVVLAGLAVSGIYAVVSNLIQARDMTPTWIMQAAIFILYISSYVYSSPDRKPAAPK
jgi:hypothetical protein